MAQTGVTIKGNKFPPRKPNFRPLAAGVESIVVGHILDRTTSGIDIDGRAFKPYSQEHSLVRRLTGRSANPVQLIWSGKMLRAVAALSRVVDGTSLTITFGVRPNDDRNLIGAYQQRTRKWFGLSAEGRKHLSAWVAQNIMSIWGAPLREPPAVRPPPQRQDKRQERGSIRREARAEIQQRRQDAAAARLQRRNKSGG